MKTLLKAQTALEKLRKLREQVKRFKELSKSLAKLDSPTLEKSLEFLDDKLLPSTSNAVERGNRRHRKMQKTVYRVRTHRHMENRIALDMFRDLRLTRRKKQRTPCTTQDVDNLHHFYDTVSIW